MNSPSSFEDSEDSSLGNNLNTEDKILKSKEKKTTKF